MNFDELGGPQKVQDLTKLDRIGTHSHITGLGLDENFIPKKVCDGLVGQMDARKAAGIICNMAKTGKISGQCVLLSGKPGTGKTALAMAIAKDIGNDTPFVSLSSSEVYSMEISKTEALTQALRKSIGIRIKEDTEIIEGEVVELIIDRSYENVSTRAGKLTLKTTDMESIYDLGNKIIDSLQKEKISPGDVITIVKATGKVTKIGRSYSRAQDFDAVSTTSKFVPCPEGELCKKKEIVHTISLHEIDIVNSRTQGFLALFSGDTGEVKSEVREQINNRIHEWVQEGKAELMSGVLFIDEVHILDIECFSFLNRALENVLSPIVILATNRGISRIKGTNYSGPHGLPFDLLDRLLIIKTHNYNEDEIRSILHVRCGEENVEMEVEALELLTKIGTETSLRYAIQLIQAANIISLGETLLVIKPQHIQKAYSLFIDENRSSNRLKELSEQYLYNEEVGEDIYSVKFL